MKNSLMVTVFVLGGMTLAHSQQFSLGPTVGVNYAWLSDAPDDAKGLAGMNAGITMVYSTEEHGGIGIEIKYSGEGMLIERRGTIAETRLNYVRVPLKFYYFFNDFGDDFRPKIYAGPSFGILAGGKSEQFLEVGTIKVDSKDLYESFDAGVTVGTGFNYRLATRTWLNFDVAYAHGLTDISKAGKAFNRNLNVNLGVAWGF